MKPCTSTAELKELSLLERLTTLKERRLECLQRPPIYVPVLCGISSLEAAKCDPLEACVRKRFSKIRPSQPVSVLLLGPSGSGKTTTMRRLEREFWKAFKPKHFGDKRQVVPIALELREIARAVARAPLTKQRSVQQDEQHLHQDEKTAVDIRKFALDQLNGLLTDADLQELEEKKTHVVWMFDGYDEMGVVQPIGQILEECKLSIVSCRDSFAYDVLEERLPGFVQPRSIPMLAKSQVLYVRGFDSQRIREYVGQAFELDEKLRDQGTVAGFTKFIQAVPGLKELATNPFMLSLIVHQVSFWAAERFSKLEQRLKSSEEDEKDGDVLIFPLDSTIRPTEVLRKFLHEQYKRALQRCCEEPEWQPSFETNFIASCEAFCREVAQYMYETDAFAVDLSQESLASRLANRLPSLDREMRAFILRSVPLEVQDNNHRSFLHRIFWEYYFALNIVATDASEEKSDQHRQDLECVPSETNFYLVFQGWSKRLAPGC